MTLGIRSILQWATRQRDSFDKRTSAINECPDTSNDIAMDTISSKGPTTLRSRTTMSFATLGEWATDADISGAGRIGGVATAPLLRNVKGAWWPFKNTRTV